jgi:hypothetical protein
MDCDVMKSELVAYHFGVVDDGARRAAEEHLLTCAGCLFDFLALKREIETADARPSRAARDRLRLAVARELGAPPRRAGWAWWERPLALGLAGFTLVGAIFAVHLLASSPGAGPHAQSTHESPL